MDGGSSGGGGASDGEGEGEGEGFGEGFGEEGEGFGEDDGEGGGEGDGSSDGELTEVALAEPAAALFEYGEKMDESSPTDFSISAKTPSANAGKPKRCDRSIFFNVSMKVAEGTGPPVLRFTTGLKRGGGG